MPELNLARALWHAGYRGYRRNSAKLPGKPDLILGPARLAVFMHGCFWHGCPTCSRNLTPKSNSEFWAEKRRKNKERDARVEVELRAMGYEVLVFWECQIKADLPGVVETIRAARERRLAELAAVKEARRMERERNGTERTK